MSTSRTREKADGELFKSTGIDDNATSTAVTIDASENVFIGQTSLNTANNGHSFGANGNYAHHTSTESTTLILNRKTSDGDILRLRKNNAQVGSIGTFNDYVTLGSGDTGLLFYNGGDVIRPHNMATNASRDNAIDLGSSVDRFKDAYLSGGVYLGGTGAANKLDDYEEGTWTPVVSGASIAASQILGTYTKIGNRVLFQCYIYGNITSNGTTPAKITGLPFTTGANGLNQTVFYVSHNTAVDGESIGGFMSNNNTQLIFLNRHPNNVAASWINGNGKEVMVGGTYFTDS